MSMGTASLLGSIQGAAGLDARVLAGDLSIKAQDVLYSDGATSARRGDATFGTVGAIAGLPASFPFEIVVPTSNPSANAHIASFTATAADPTSVNNAFTIRLNTSGTLVVSQRGATGTIDARDLAYTGFRAAYSGLRVRGMVVFSAGNSTTLPATYINGVDVSSAFTLVFGSSGEGSAPNWMPLTLDTTKFLSGFNWSAGRFVPHAPIVGALTAAEVLDWTQTGRLPSWCGIGVGSAVSATSGTLTIGRKYRLKDYITGDSFTNVGAASNADGVEFVATGATPTTWTNSSEVITLGPLSRWEIQPVGTCYDAGTNKIPLLLTAGVTPITSKRDWIIQDATATNGNKQILSASVFVAPYDYTRHVLDDWCMKTAGTPTVTAGSASAGTEYKASAALAATRNMITLATRVVGTANIWVGSNGTDSIQHTIRGHIAD